MADDDSDEAEVEAADALSLHLAGWTLEQIAAHLSVPADVARAQIDQAFLVHNPNTPRALAEEIERVSRLWRGIYTQAVKGDTEAVGLAIRLSQYRSTLTARSPVRPPDPAHANLAPTVAVRTAWQILAGSAPQVAQSLVDIATSSPNDGARVTAAIAVMDRVGIGRVERSEVAVHLLDHSAQQQDPANFDAVTDTPAAVVRARLKAIAARASHDEDADADIIDAVVVLDDDG